MSVRTPRPAADAETRQVLELLRNSWTLALRADELAGFLGEAEHLLAP